jgi:hypothetical protein
MCRSTFLDMICPADGTVVEVRHGPDQEVVRAYWAAQNQAFVRADLSAHGSGPTFAHGSGPGRCA